jgi:hypothetical protein
VTWLNRVDRDLSDQGRNGSVGMTNEPRGLAPYDDHTSIQTKRWRQCVHEFARSCELSSECNRRREDRAAEGPGSTWPQLPRKHMWERVVSISSRVTGEPS